ncbi:MAG: GAF domain-containing protein, partial [Deltaproteobacteria bacterium]
MALFKKDTGKIEANDLEALEKDLQFSRRLHFITSKIHSSKDIDDILINMMESVLSLFDADRITIYVVDEASKELVSRFKTGEETNEIRVPISNKSIAGHSAVSGKIVSVENAYDSNELKRINPELAFDSSWDGKTGYTTKQVLAAPITFGKDLLGVIQLINKINGKHFTAEDRESAIEMAKVLGIAFHNHRRLEQHIKRTKFDYLISNTIISQKDLEHAMLVARKTKSSVESVLINDYHVTKEDIGKSLSMFYNTRFIAYDERMAIPGQLLKGLKPTYLKRSLFVPVDQSESKTVIAMENPDYLPGQDAIRGLIPGKEFEFCVSLKEDIIRMIDYFFDRKRSKLMAGSESIEEILGQLGTGEAEADDEREGVSEEDGATVQLINKMVVDAYDKGASDIHIEPRMGKADAVVRFRVDGACQVYQTIPYTYKNALCSRIKIMGDLDIA